jgi:hypothetical protein
MNLKNIVLMVPLFLLGCVSTNEFVNYAGADSASVTVSRKPDESFQTAIRVVSESQLKLAGKQSLACYDETEDYWRHAESLGHWNDKPDVFQLKMKVSNEKQYVMVKNWIIGIACGGVLEFTPEAGADYQLEITGLMPNCDLILTKNGNPEQKVSGVKQIPECR